MNLLILVTGILISIVFDRQQRRHRVEKMWEYRRLNMPMPLPAPKLSTLQSWLNIMLGVILAAFGCLSVAPLLHAPIPAANEMLSTSALFIGGGSALIILGTMALRERRHFESLTRTKNQ